MQYYTYILSFHVISVMSWMAVLFYMPRLFVYHQEHAQKKDFTDVVEIQEDKIYSFIGVPAMWASIVSGATILFLNTSLFYQDWMIAKIIVLVVLIAYSYSMEYYRKQLKAKKCKKSGQFFRAYNEIPTLLGILIVTYVITKSIPAYFSIGITLFFGFIIYKILTLKKKS